MGKEYRARYSCLDRSTGWVSLEPVIATLIGVL